MLVHLTDFRQDVAHALPHKQLFYQSGRELLFVWERVRDILPKVREVNHHSRELKNLEDAAAAYISWWNQTSPGAFDAFSKRVRG